MKTIRMLFNFLKGSRLVFFTALIAICIASMFMTVIPLVSKVIIDSVIGDKPMGLPAWIDDIIISFGGREFLAKNLWVCGIALILITAGNGIFEYIKGKLTAMASENSGKRLREKLYDHILHLPYDYHVRSQAGDLIQRCTSDVETIQNFTSTQLVEVGQCVISFSLVLFAMFSINTYYTIICNIFVPVVLVGTAVFFGKMKRIFQKTDEAEGAMTSTLQENLTGIRVVKAFGAQNFENAKFDADNMGYRNNVIKIVNLMANFWASMNLITMTQFCLILFSGVYWTNTGKITLGVMVAFLTYSMMLIFPVRQLGQIFANMGQAFVSLTRINEVLNYPAETIEDAEIKPRIKGEIEFENVCFGYNNDSLLDNLSFRIGKGQTAAFLGATGSGKSTLVHLLLRLYDYNKGSIKIDGVELKKIERKWLRSHIGVVLQEPFLFSKTISENIMYGNPDAGESDIRSSSVIAALHDTVMSFDKGYDTIIGERGVTLSGGQKQRLTIARAVVRNVPILIFDDSLSAVDMETDALIRRALKQRSRDTTTIIISHRISTLSEADIIFVLEHGRISLSGTHEELIAQDGLYKRVWELQSSIESELLDFQEGYYQ